MKSSSSVGLKAKRVKGILNDTPEVFGIFLFWNLKPVIDSSANILLQTLVHFYV